MRPGSWVGTAAVLSALMPLSADSDLALLQQRIATLTSRRAELVHRLAAIEADPNAPLLLRSPVDIRDSAGHSIVYISQGDYSRGVTVFNERQQNVAGLDGSTVFTLTGQGAGGVRLAYTKNGPFLQMWNGANQVAGIGADGFVSFSPGGNQMTAQLGATYAEAGYLWLGDAGGGGLVEAGMLSKRKNVGVVRVAPFIPRMEVLLPITPYRTPNFIRGYRPQ